MAGPMVFEEKEKFLERLRGLVREGVPGERIRVITPFGVPEVEEILPGKRSKVRFFALVGAASGTVTGFAFTILTSLSWPLIVGGKPIVSSRPSSSSRSPSRSCSAPCPRSRASSSCPGCRASAGSGRGRSTGTRS